MALPQGDWDRVRAAFDHIVDLPFKDRAEAITRADLPGPLDAELRALINVAARDGVLDRQPPAAEEPVPAVVEESPMRPGMQIGSFQITALIGQGGMGEVYAATRVVGGFGQCVALKLVRADSAAYVAMFARERRLLAGLEHPGIARLIDGGVTADGRAWMAMELVDGRQLDAWLREDHPTLEQRLRIFIEICEIIAYAHARLVVHRDLKPSNILIDADTRPRLLDFGVARLLEDSAAVEPTQSFATPEYAAPEQLERGLTTVATDVFALGALLFVLLTGRGPWQDAGSGMLSMARRILREDAPPPSRAADPADIPAGRLRGDLDAIVGKAMRRAPDARYRSAAEMAGDVANYLANRPVMARAGSRRYRLGRFVVRNRWQVVAAAALVLAIVVGVAGIAWQARNAAIQRDVALAEVTRSQAVVRTLTLLFRNAQEYGAGGDATVKQMLDDSAVRLAATLDRSGKSGVLVTTVADLYTNIEDPLGAKALLQQAAKRGVGADDPAVVAQMDLRLATATASLGEPDVAAPILARAERVFDAAPDRFAADRVEAVAARALIARNTGDRDAAITLLQNVIPQAERAYAGNPRDLLTIYNNLLVYMVEANRMDDLPGWFARVDGVIRRTGEGSSVQALAVRQLRGVVLFKQLRFAEAEPVLAQVVDARRRKFGRSAGLAVDLLQLARVKLPLGKAADAVALLTEALPLAERHLGGGAVPTVVIAATLAEALAESGDPVRADTLLAPLFASAKGPIEGIVLRARAIVRLKQGRMAEAKADAARGEAVFRSLGPAGAAYLPAMAKLRARIGL